MWQFIWAFIKEHTESLWKGFVAGGIVWGGVLFSDIPDRFGVGIYMLRLMGALVLAIATAIGTAVGTDIYKHRIKNKIFNRKKKQDGKRRNDEEQAA